MTLHEEWLRYEQNTVPPSATKTQRREMYRAFFFGTEALYRLLMTQTSGADREPTHADLNLLEGMHSEISRFLKSVAEGTDHPAGSLGGNVAERSWMNLYRRALEELSDGKHTEFVALFAGNVFDLSITFGKHAKSTYARPADGS